MQTKATEFDQISKNIFYPIYPVIAQQILAERKGISEGTCLDVGSGPGYVGLSIARQSKMQVCLYDMDQNALEIAKKNINEALLEDRVFVKYGNVEEIPYPNESFDLVTSRGSLFFWQDKVKAINEIFRVLKMGGTAYLGGGFGNQKLKDMVDQKMLAIDDQWLVKAAMRKGCADDYENLLKKTIVKQFTVKEDDSGLWIVFHKTSEPTKEQH
ncbi:class I SAM-dependent methyltransferase [Acetobacterium bakii]|uniref:Methyltransferase type 11 domain-containing protein n=1 Tax=Acetobacterium bakii TaxID=52689 RepID=A0A0L6TVU0_9FIRM|nr:class I SAM-dependent methyltransferase [Acetobacterium bakii]KNZ40371.1 hypothetical protein AKG39_17990 [Acetobacterium bakii]